MTETGGQEGKQVTQGTPPARTESSKLPPFNPSVPNPARMWNYWLGGKDNFAAADLRDTDTILKGTAHTLDLTRPVAVLLIAVLHFIPDADDPYAVVARLMVAVPSGSYLVMAHAASDIAPEASAEMARRYNAMSSASITPRSRGMVVLAPGRVTVRPRGAGPPARLEGSNRGRC
jgi:hypothetical protein